MARRSVIAPIWLLATLTPIAVSVVGCKTAAPHRQLPRYIVSATPLPLIDVRHPGICVAVEPAAHRGVWWWDAGREGCRSASSGLMNANGGIVSQSSSSATIDVSFQIGLVSGETRKITLELRDGRMRESASGLEVATERRDNVPD